MTVPKRPLAALMLGMALTIVTACGNSGSGTAAPPSSTVPVGPPVVKVATTKLGPTLVDAAGHTLYVYDADPDNQSTCLSGVCAFRFHAFIVPSDTFAVGPGLKASQFGTTGGLNGTRVLAVNRRPLYTCVNDPAPGQTSCEAYGKLWWAVSPAGVAITKG